MKPPAYSLRQLAYFVATADSGTIALAAKKLNVSPSAISDSISELERVMAVNLCVRRKARGFSLTAAGARLLPEARTILQRADDLTATIGARKGELSGPLTISCYPTLAPTVLPVFLDDFGGAHSGISMQILETTNDQLAGKLESGVVDAAIVYDWLVPGNPRRMRLFELRPHVLLAGNHPLADRKSLRLEELLDDELILYDVTPANTHTMNIFAKRNLHPTIAHRTTSFEVVRALVARSLGYSILVQRIPNTASYEGLTLKVLEIEPPVATVGIDLIWPDRPDLPISTRALIDFASSYRWPITPLTLPPPPNPV